MRRVRLWHIILYTAGVVTLFMLPVGQPHGEPTWLDLIGADKIFHAIVFFFFTLLLAGYAGTKRVVSVVVIICGFAAGTEALQVLSSYHIPSFWDWLADMSGCTAAMWFILHRRRRLPHPAPQGSSQCAPACEPATPPSEPQEEQSC